MKKMVPQISLCLLLLSLLIYAAGRWAVKNPMPDDTGDWFLWSGGIAALVLLFSTIKGAPLNFKSGFNKGVAVVAVFLAAFGTWGMFTDHGQKQFPEMAGMAPFFALILAGALAFLLVIFNLIWRAKARDAQ
jgi:hypothetical protein